MKDLQSQNEVGQLQIWQQTGNFCSIAETLPIDDPRGKLIQAEAFLRLGEFDQADALLQTTMADPVFEAQRKLLKARLAQDQAYWTKANSSFIDLLDNSNLPVGWGEGYYGIFLFNTEQFQLAEEVLLNAQKRLDPNEELAAIVNKVLGNLYGRLSKNTSAEAYLQKAEAWWVKQGRLKHPDYAEVLNDLAIVKILQNELVAAGSLLKESKKIQTFCPLPLIEFFHVSVENALRNAVGDYEGSIKLLQNFLDQTDTVRYPKNKAVLLADLGSSYWEVFYFDSLSRVEGLFSQAFQLIESTHPGILLPLTKANIIGRIAGVTDDQPADSLYRLQQNILANSLGTENIYYAAALNDYGYFLEYLEQFSEAGQFFQRSLKITQDIYGAQHPETLTTLYNIASFYAAIEDHENAIQTYLDANEKQLINLRNTFASFDERTRLQARLEALGNFDVFFNYAVSIQDPRTILEMQRISLETKNLALGYTVQYRNFLAKSVLSDHQKNQYTAWQTTRQALLRAHSLSAPDLKLYSINLDSLQNQAEKQERLLIQSEPGQYSSADNISYSKMCQQLRHDEILIDILAFEYHDGYEYVIDSLLYFAMISRKDQKLPSLEYLGNSEQLEKLLSRTQHYTQNFRTGYELYQQIWAPLEPYMDGIRTVHISPDGLLFQVAYEGLFNKTDDPENSLGDAYRFFYHSNIHDFRAAKGTQISPNSALLVGDPTYTPSIEQWNDWFEGKNDQSTLTQIPFMKLPGTRNEVLTIDSIFTREGIKTRLLIGPQASEVNFIQQFSKTYSFDVIHIASHGYFVNKNLEADPTSLLMQDRFARSTNPMVRSGLILAGGNYAWSGGSVPPGKADGILMADEIQNLDLQRTKLVVLSACETGRGSVAHGEGVFGLQRAFQAAGVDQFIISLWKVPDAQTSELMTAFYEELTRGKNASDALFLAQQTIKSRYPPPFYWSGFVLYQ